MFRVVIILKVRREASRRAAWVHKLGGEGEPSVVYPAIVYNGILQGGSVGTETDVRGLLRLQVIPCGTKIQSGHPHEFVHLTIYRSYFIINLKIDTNLYMLYSCMSH